jgi:ABC-2 type transport system permease protein
MNFQRIYAIFIRQWFLITGNPVRLIDIVQWGFISKYLGGFGGATFSFVTVVLGAVIFWEFMTRIQQGIMTAFLEDVWAQNFINYFASPLKIKEYLSGLVMASIATTLTGSIAMVLVAGFAFGYNIFKIGVMIIPFLLVLFIFGMAIGIFVSAFILRFGPAAEWLGWPIPMVLSIISGVYYPISALPIFLQYLARLTPAARVFESFRYMLTTGQVNGNIWNNLAVALVLALGYLYFAYRYFYHVYKRNLKTGSIAKFSAEYGS